MTREDRRQQAIDLGVHDEAAVLARDFIIVPVPVYAGPPVDHLVIATEDGAISRVLGTGTS